MEGAVHKKEGEKKVHIKSKQEVVDKAVTKQADKK